jgi:predicted O-methyltransferase YrrM
MFHDVPQPIRRRMAELEAIDARDRDDGTPRPSRLRQVSPETGRFIALLAASAPNGQILEIGTSAGYSTLWLVLACRHRGCRVRTFEVLPAKVAIALETFERTGTLGEIELVPEDARDHLAACEDVGFCFIDCEKDAYAECYDAVVPNLVPGGLLLADNAINHHETLAPMLDAALADDRVDAMIVPIGTGVLVCRRV